MPLGAVDYAASYFKYKTSTPTHGATTNEPLKRLKTDLRANASSVKVDLGGRDYGYLGLVLIDVEYRGMTTYPPRFNTPNYPIHCTFCLVQVKSMLSQSGPCTIEKHTDTTKARRQKSTAASHPRCH